MEEEQRINTLGLYESQERGLLGSGDDGRSNGKRPEINGTQPSIERRGCRGNQVPTNEKGIVATKHRGKDERYFVNGNAKLVCHSDTCDATNSFVKKGYPAAESKDTSDGATKYPSHQSRTGGGGGRTPFPFLFMIAVHSRWHSELSYMLGMTPLLTLRLVMLSYTSEGS